MFTFVKIFTHDKNLQHRPICNSVVSVIPVLRTDIILNTYSFASFWLVLSRARTLPWAEDGPPSGTALFFSVGALGPRLNLVVRKVSLWVGVSELNSKFILQLYTN